MPTSGKPEYGLFWPRVFASDVTTPVKVGRLLHWLGLAVGAACVCYGAFMVVFIMPGLLGILKMASATCYGAGSALFGRMARMVLARE